MFVQALFFLRKLPKKIEEFVNFLLFLTFARNFYETVYY